MGSLGTRPDWGRAEGTGVFPGPLENTEAERGVRHEGTCASPGSKEVQGSAPRALGTPGLRDVKPARLSLMGVWVAGGISGFSPESVLRGLRLPAVGRAERGRSWGPGP